MKYLGFKLGFGFLMEKYFVLNLKQFFFYFTFYKNYKFNKKHKIIKQKQNLSCFFSSPRPFYYAIL